MAVFLTAFDFSGYAPLTARLRRGRNTIGFADGCTLRLPLDTTEGIPRAKLEQPIADLTFDKEEGCWNLSGSFEELQLGARSKHLLFGSVPNFPNWAGWNPTFVDSKYKLENGENVFFLVYNDAAPQRFRLIGHVQLNIQPEKGTTVGTPFPALPEELMLEVLRRVPVDSLSTIIPAVCRRYHDFAVENGFFCREMRAHLEFSYAGEFLKSVFKRTSKALDFCDSTPARNMDACAPLKWEVELKDWFHPGIHKARVKAQRLKFIDSFPSPTNLFVGLTELEIDDSCLFGLGEDLPLNRMTNLRKLSIVAGYRTLCDFQERVLVDIEDLEHLECLSILGYIHVLARAWVSFIGGLRSRLKRLVLIHCVQITDESMLAISRKFPALEKLIVTGSPRLSPALVDTLTANATKHCPKSPPFMRMLSHDNCRFRQ